MLPFDMIMEMIVKLVVLIAKEFKKTKEEAMESFDAAMTRIEEMEDLPVDWDPGE